MPNANAPSRDVIAATGASASSRRGGVAKALTVLAGAGLLFWALASASVPCGFARAFHMPCPGCGSTRAMLCLFHGDLAGVIRMNPLAPFLSLLVALFVGQIVVSLATTGSLQRIGEGLLSKVTTRGFVAIAVLEVLVWALRFAGLFGGPVPV